MQFNGNHRSLNDFLAKSTEGVKVVSFLNVTELKLGDAAPEVAFSDFKDPDPIALMAHLSSATSKSLYETAKSWRAYGPRLNSSVVSEGLASVQDPHPAATAALNCAKAAAIAAKAAASAAALVAEAVELDSAASMVSSNDQELLSTSFVSSTSARSNMSNRPSSPVRRGVNTTLGSIGSIGSTTSTRASGWDLIQQATLAADEAARAMDMAGKAAEAAKASTQGLTEPEHVGQRWNKDRVKTKLGPSDLFGDHPMQLCVDLKWDSQAVLTVASEVKVDFPYGGYIALPIELSVEQLSIEGTFCTVLSGESVLVFFETNPRVEMVVKSSLGGDKQLKNADKIESFLVEQLRKFILDKAVLPNAIPVHTWSPKMDNPPTQDHDFEHHPLDSVSNTAHGNGKPPKAPRKSSSSTNATNGGYSNGPPSSTGAKNGTRSSNGPTRSRRRVATMGRVAKLNGSFEDHP